jgi:AcrR family transcriptional regulator
MSAGERNRSREAAEQALIAAAAELLGEIGPRATSVRDIAARAGVNHGLVHHYFGGKDGLLREGMKRLVHEHHEFATQRSVGGIVPVPLGLTGDQRYLRAVARCVLDGEMGLARTELDEGVSVPNQALVALTEHHQLREPTLAMKAELALAAATEMGWAALEPFLFLVAGVRPNEQHEVRELARQLREAQLHQHLASLAETALP